MTAVPDEFGKRGVICVAMGVNGRRSWVVEVGKNLRGLRAEKVEAIEEQGLVSLEPGPPVPVKRRALLLFCPAPCIRYQGYNMHPQNGYPFQTLF